jgi:hypothetical protein
MLTPDQLNKAKKLLKFSQNPQLASFEEMQTLTETLSGLLQAVQNVKIPEPAQELKLAGVDLVTIKGDKGDQGEVGPQGPQGESITGPQGAKGDKGDRGDQGPQGERGLDGLDGIGGQPGKDGNPDTPEQILAKLHSLPPEEQYQIDASHIKGLPESKNYHMFGGSTSRIVTVKDEGTVISKLLRSLNFVGSGVQATSDHSGNITITISGGTAASESNGETLTDSGNHTTFTFAHAPQAGGVRNVWQKETGQLLTPTADYTVAGSTLTATSAQVDGNGNPFTLIANYTY